MERNREAFVRLAQLVAEAEINDRYNQTVWTNLQLDALYESHEVTIDPKKICGTAYCLAGWDQAGLGHLVVNGGCVYEMIETITIDGSKVLKVGKELGQACDLAQQHLGLDDWEAEHLFASGFKFNCSSYDGLMALADGASVYDVEFDYDGDDEDDEDDEDDDAL